MVFLLGPYYAIYGLFNAEYFMTTLLYLYVISVMNILTYLPKDVKQY